METPLHLQNSGRIASLNEFRQRVETYHNEDLPNDFVYLSDTTTPNNPPRREESVMRNERIVQKSHWLTKRIAWMRRQGTLLLFLFILGMIAGPLTFSIRRSYLELLNIRRELTKDEVEWVGYLIWTSWCMIGTIGALWWTSLSPTAEGSGLPQMKTVLTGVDQGFYLPGFFKVRTFVAKVGGIILAVGSGLIVGTEGAVVHMMAIVATHLMRIPCFRHFSDKNSTRLQILASACAVGVASNFSSPIGGVLFSIEVTATYYTISNYWKSFVSTIGAAMLALITKYIAEGVDSIHGMEIVPYATQFPTTPYHLWEIFPFILLGLCLGFVGSTMVHLIKKVALFRMQMKKEPLLDISPSVNTFLWKYLDPICIAFLTGTLTWWLGDASKQSVKEILDQLFSIQELPEIWTSTNVSSSFLLPLFLYFMTHIVLLPLTISLRIPSGTWIPTFVAGAAIGRFYGELLKDNFPDSDIDPGAYSLVGAASLAGSVTQTVSAAVIALEVTGQLQLVLPVLLGVLFSIGASKMFGPSVYTALLHTRSLPYTPDLDFDSSASVGDVMKRNFIFVSQNTTIVKVLMATHSMPGQEIPVVYSTETPLLLGSLHCQQLKDFCHHFYKEHGLKEFKVDVGDPVVRPSTNRNSWLSLKSILTTGANSNVDDIAISVDRLMQRRNGTTGIPLLDHEARLKSMLMAGWSEEKKRLLQLPIALTPDVVGRIKPMPLTLCSETLLEDAHQIFTMLRCNHCYVTDLGKLSGILTTGQMLTANSNK